jgi:DNA-binding NarL/FixJ family response regulator
MADNAQEHETPSELSLKAAHRMLKAMEDRTKPLTPELLGLMLDEFLNQSFRSRSNLTATEQRVAEVAAEGLKVREIAQICGITPGTVKTHLKRIYDKKGVGDRRGLAVSLRQKTVIRIDP